MKNKIFISLLFLATYIVNAQVFPVQINSNINRPYLPSVSSYATVPAQNYLVNIFTADLTVINRAAKLKIYIEGNGILAQSNPVVVGAQNINLNGGETLNLNNTDLAPYFELQNLSGINQQQYSNNFAQGTYNFCVEVYDAITNQKISQKTCIPFYFLYNEPPFLNLPANNGVVQFQDPTNILFTWTPRHLNATNIEYKFKLIEVPQGLDPNIVILAPNPLYEVTTNNTVLNYDMVLPQLIEGKKYAWRVQAVQTQGFGEFAVFNNNGYSQVYSFDYPGPCEAPLNVLSSALSATSCQINWTPSPKHIDFVVQYRKLATTAWFTTSHNNNTAVIHGLEAGATYEFQVGGKCVGDATIFSQINTFLQPSQNLVALNCGIAPSLNLTNVVLYTANLETNDAFIAGDFTIHVLSSAVAGDKHTGEGYVKVPYLGFAKIAVEYADIKLNTDKKLVDGVVKFKYDPTWSNVLDINELLDLVEDQFDSLSPDIEENIDSVSYVAATVTAANGHITVTGANGQTQTFDQDKKEINVITDANGNVWGVPADSNTPQLLQQGSGFIANSVNTNGVGANGQVTGITTTNGYKVTFEKVADAAFGDDILKATDSPKIQTKYKTIKDQGNNDYPVLYKYVIGSGEIPKTDYVPAKDKIRATISGGTKEQKAKVVFSIHGVRVGKDVAFGDNNSIILEVPVFDTSTEGELIAFYDPSGHMTGNPATTANGAGANTNNTTTTAGEKPSVLGVAKIISGKLVKDVEVEIIPVNGASVPSVQEATAALNAIYKPVGVNFLVTIAPNFDYTKKTTIDCGKDYLLENYTPEMRDFKNEYTKTNKFDKSKYYLFATKNIAPSKALDGFMPLHRQYGFIFKQFGTTTVAPTPTTGESQISPKTFIQVVAHELGHGVFELDHPKFDYGAEKTTSWLMDNNAGLDIPFMHLQKISHPKFGVYIFQDMEQGELEDGNVIVGINNNKNPILFNIETSCNRFFVKGKIARFNSVEISKIKGLDIDEKGNLIKATNLENKVYSLARTLSLEKNNTNEIKQAYAADKLVCFQCIDEDILHKKMRENIKKETKTDDGKTVSVYTGISKDSDYILAKFEILEDCAVGKQVLKLSGDTFICKTITQEDCDEFKSNDSSSKLTVWDLTNFTNKTKIKALEDKLKDIFQGKKENKLTGEKHKLKTGALIYNGQSANIEFVNNVLKVNGKIQDLSAYDIYLILNYNEVNNKITVKNIWINTTVGLTIENTVKNISDAVNWNQKTFIEKITAINYSITDGTFTGLYDFLDLLSSGISKAKIQPSVYDCGNKDYNPIYAKVFSYINFLSLIQDKIVVELIKAYPEYNNILKNKNATPSRIQFALFCGVYNGLIDVIKSIPDLAKLLISPLSTKGKDEISKFINQLKEKPIYLEDESTLACNTCDKGDISLPKIWYFLKEGISSKLTMEKPCETAEFVGSIAGPIVVMCLGDEVAGTGILAKVTSSTIKFFQYCDKLADPFRYAGMTFKYIKKVNGKMFLLVKNTAGDVIRQLDNGIFKVKVIINNTETVIEITEDNLELLMQDTGTGALIKVGGENKIVKLLGRIDNVVSGAGSLLDELTLAVKNSCNADELAELAQDVTSFNLAKTQPQQFINGKNFEKGIGNLIDNGDQTFLNQVANHANVNLTQYTPIKQLQINLPNGGYMIADNAWVKQINVGGQIQFEVILNECKLSSLAPWTTRQTELLNSLNGGNITFTSRSAKAEIASIIPQNSTIKIKTVVKTEGAGTGHSVTKVY